MRTLAQVIEEKTEKAQKWIKDNEILGITRIKHYAGFRGVHIEIQTNKDWSGISWMVIKYIE